MKSGKLIVIEGLSGVGKSTTANIIMSQLDKLNISYIYNHGACSSSEFGRDLKKYMKKNSIDYKRAYEVAPYFVADLLQNTINVIKPKLEEGIYVVQDRYIDSVISYYRFIGRALNKKIDLKPIFDLYLNLDLFLTPDINILCIADQKVILERLKVRQAEGKASSVHQQYITDPTLIDYHQDEFIKLHNSYATGRKMILNTGSEDDYRKLETNLTKSLLNKEISI